MSGSSDNTEREDEHDERAEEEPKRGDLRAVAPFSSSDRSVATSRRVKHSLGFALSCSHDTPLLVGLAVSR